MTDDPPIKVSGSYAGIEDTTLLEYGKKALQDSPEILMNFIKLMIPLTTALITTYFALLKFIGVETMNTVEFGQNYLGPPFLMLISLIAFIVGAFPVKKGLNIEDPNSIREFRDAAMDWKYTSCIFGSAFFLFAIGLMIYLNGFPPSAT